MRKLQIAITIALLLVLAVVGFLAYKLREYESYQEAIYPGVSAAGIPLQGQTPEQARQTLEEMVVAPLGRPIALKYQDETLVLLPSDVGLKIFVDDMVVQAHQLGRGAEPQFWEGYVKFLTGGLKPVNEDIPLLYTYQPQMLADFLREIARAKDQPLREVQPITETLSFRPGAPGRRLDIQSSLPLVESILTSPEQREVMLVVDTLEPAPPDMEMLRSMLQHRIDEFAGIVGLYVVDLASGQRVEINSHVVYSGTSVAKVAIMLETLLRFEGEELDEQTQEIMLKMITDTVPPHEYSNYWANQLLALVGDGSQIEGCRRVSARMAELGLTSTFIRSPYRLGGEEGAHRSPGLARIMLVQAPIYADPDPFIQTSPRDIGDLLEMIYQCSNGEGRLLEEYAGRITSEGCQLVLDDLKQNPVLTMIGQGIPEGTPLAHKHGFASDTHADAGIVFSPGGDYILVHFQYAPTTWLVWALSKPVFEDVSFATYNFFNIGVE